MELQSAMLKSYEANVQSINLLAEECEVTLRDVIETFLYINGRKDISEDEKRKALWKHIYEGVYALEAEAYEAMSDV